MSSPAVTPTTAPLTQGEVVLESATPRSPSLLRHNLRYCLLDGVAAMPISILGQPGNVVLASLLSGMFGLSPAHYGLIISLPFWFNFLQVLVTPRLSQQMDARWLCLITAWLQFAGWVLLTAALPFIPRADTPLTLGIFFVGFSIISCAGAVNGVTWNAWMQEVVPQRLRGKYFGMRNQVLQVSMLAFLLSVSGLTALLQGSLLAYVLLFGGALGVRILSILAMQRMVTPGPADAKATQESAPLRRLAWREQLRVLMADHGFIRFVGFGALMAFFVSLFGPFLPVFMYEELDLDVARANWILLFGPVGAAVSFPAWGRLLDRYGNIPVMIVSLGLWQLFALIWCVVDQANLWLLYVAVPAGGMFSAGYGIGLFALMLKLMPPSARTLGVALFISLSSLAAALAPPLGGYLITWAKEFGLAPFSIYRTAFVVTPIASIFGALILRRVREENAARVGEVVGAMRNVRTVTALFGLSFLVNQVFYRKAGRRRRGQPRLTRLFS